MKNESKTAVYLKYNDLNKFRKFKFCSIVFEWYIQFHVNCQSFNVRETLQLIRNTKIFENIFPRDIKIWNIIYSLYDDFFEKNKKKITDNRIYKYVIILYKLNENLERKNLYEDLNEHIIQTFETILAVKISDFFTNIVWSILKSLINEKSLKKYNKMNDILKNLQNSLAFIKWNNIYEKKKTSFEKTLIISDHISVWMQFSKNAFNFSKLI